MACKAVADWKHAGLYLQYTNLSLNRWAWEFLRRSPSYQGDFAVAQELKREILGDHSDKDATWWEETGYPTLVASGKWWKFFDPPTFDNESVEEYLARVGTATRMPFDGWIAKKHGLEGCSPTLPDPFADMGGSSVPKVAFSSSRAVVQPGPAWHGFNQTPGREIELALAFDLRDPIDNQINDARTFLEDKLKALVQMGVIEAHKPGNKRLNEWPRYLRILDAIAAGIHDAKIIEIIFEVADINKSDEMKYNKNKAEAMRLRDDGYRELPRMKP